MNVLVVEPGYAPYEEEINGLQEMQEVVGGLIQAIYPFQEPVAVVCNDDGLFLGLPFNRSLDGGYGGVCGTFFICGRGEENFFSLTPEQIQTYKERFFRAELLIGGNSNEPITLKVTPWIKNGPSKQREPPEPFVR